MFPLKWAFIVSFPFATVIFHSFLYVYQRVFHSRFLFWTSWHEKPPISTPCRTAIEKWAIPGGNRVEFSRVLLWKWKEGSKRIPSGYVKIATEHDGLMVVSWDFMGFTLWLLSSFPFKTVIIQSYVKLLEGKLDSLMLFLYHMLFRVNYNDLTSTSLGMMVNKGNHPQMA